MVEHTITWAFKKCFDMLPKFSRWMLVKVVFVEDTGFRLPPIEAMFNSIGWFIAVLVVVAEVKNST